MKRLNLDFFLDEDHCKLVSESHYECDKPNQTLLLDGESEFITLDEVRIDGDSLPVEAYELTENTLTLKGLPQVFTLTIVTHFHPKEKS